MLPTSSQFETVDDHRKASVRCVRSERGFSLVEMVICVAILLILGGLMAPRVLGMVQAQRMQTTTRSYASFLQQCRYRAEQDGTYYEVLFAPSNGATLAYLDLNGNNALDPTEPTMEIPQPIAIDNPLDANIPAGFGNANLLGATPLPVITPPVPATFNQNGAQIGGLQFNERGLPCQRTAANSPCSNPVTYAGPPAVTAPVAWITYFTYPTGNNGVLWAAVTVTPAGRVKVWQYQDAAGGGGNWR